MDITRETMINYIYNPNLVQKVILDHVEQASNGEIVISEPTNPFTMLLETAAVTSANAVIEAKSVIRKKYPNLATRPDELYHHITDDELVNMFAIPAKVRILFYINIMDLMNVGYRPQDANFVETTIPDGTEITILDTTLTILNDIVIKLYDNGSIFVEQQTSNNDLAYQDIGILNADRISNKDGVPWILFETEVKQVKKYTKNIAVTTSEGFSQVVDIDNSYVYSEVSYKNNNTNNRYVVIPKTHSIDYINPVVPTVNVSVYDKNVLFKIPDLYLMNGSISGNVNIDVYDTKGKMYLPINKYNMSDYKLVLGNTTKNQSAATSVNITINVNSRSIIEGGTNGMTMEELRTSIINNTKGDIDLPITEHQLKRYSMMEGYDIYKVEDSVTDRLYVATKSLPKVTSNLVYSRPDVFFNTVGIVLNDIVGHYNVNITSSDFIIKSNTMFKESKGIVSIVNKDEVDYINSLSLVNKIEYLKMNKYFYTPYYYVIENDDRFSYVRVYNLDTPAFDNLRISGKNSRVIPRVNIDRYGIYKRDNGYDLLFSLKTNDEFKKIPQDDIILQVKLPIKGTNVFAYFNAEYMPDSEFYSVKIDSNLYIDSEEYIQLDNGISELYSKSFNINTTIEIFVMTDNPNIEDPDKYLVNEVYHNGVNPVTVFSKEILDVKFGYNLNYIWNKVYNTYTERKYQTYTTDMPLVYNTDVYEIFPETNSRFKYETIDGVQKLISNKLYSKGTIVRDENNEIVYKHKAGDIILDDAGKPIVDQMSGVIRYLDIIMMEYEFFATTSNIYKNYMSNMMDVLHKYLTQDLPNMNNLLLENTKLLYKTYVSNKNIVININNIYYSVPYLIKPVITIYSNKQDPYNIEALDQFKVIIGNIINQHLDNTEIKLINIKNDILQSLGSNIVAVKVSGLDPNDSEILSLKEKTSRFTINKQLDIVNNELIVKYDLTLVVQYV